MKKAILYWFSFLFILLWMTSCATKKTVEKTSVTKDVSSTTVTKDSSKISEINRKIDDAMRLLVTKSNSGDAEFDRKVNLAVDEILAKINLQKTSGNNSFSIDYDRITRELRVNAQVGETKDEVIATNKDSKVEKSFEQTTDEYISKKVSSIPWWIYLIVVVWFLPQIISRIMLITNPVMGLIRRK